MWPGTIRPTREFDVVTLDFNEEAIDTMSDGSVLELAYRVGVLLEEERQFPSLVRMRLKRNVYA